MNEIGKAVLRLLFQHGSMEFYDIKKNLYMHSSVSVESAMYSLMESEYVNRCPVDDFLHDLFSLTEKGIDFIHETYGKDCPQKILEQEKLLSV